MSALMAIVFAIMGGFLTFAGLSGREAPKGRAVALASPLLRGEGYCAMSAGSNLVLNLHYVEGEKTAASFEKHSVDFIRLGPRGTRTVAARSWHPKPLQPADYAVFDAPVLAPCDGLVKTAVSDRPDNLAGHRYRRLDGANRVELVCKGTEIWLAHLKRGSVTVSAGERVSVGDVLGVVGNSGNTEEPHLHIHAQTIPADNTPGAVPEPVVMYFDERYFARGDCL